MWCVSKINPITHEVEVQDSATGESHAFVVPEGHRTRDLKHTYIKNQISAIAPMRKAKTTTAVSVLSLLLTVETVAFLIFLLRLYV